MRFRGNDSPAKDRHLPRMLVTILATLTVANVVSADPYVYSSPSLPSLPLSYAYKSLPRPSSSPPLPYVYTSPPPPPPSPLAPYGPRHHLAVKVVGKVYCLRCYNWKYPKISHGKKHLKGTIMLIPHPLISCIFCLDFITNSLNYIFLYNRLWFMLLLFVRDLSSRDVDIRIKQHFLCFENVH